MRTAVVCVALLAAALAVASRLTEGFAVWTTEGARRLAVQRHPVALPAARLTSASGQPWSLPARWTGSGKVWIADFIYTRCTSLCSVLGTQYQQLQRQILDRGLAERVGLLSVSFDPMHDGPAVLSHYATRMRADPAVWQLLVPDDKASLAGLLSSFGVTVIDDGQQGFQHNAALHVVDASGKLRRIFDYTEVNAALAFAHTIAIGSGV